MQSKKTIGAFTSLMILVVILIILTIINMSTTKKGTTQKINKLEATVKKSSKENSELKQTLLDQSNHAAIEEPLNIFIDLYYGTTPDLTDEERNLKLAAVLSAIGREEYIPEINEFDKKYHPQANDNQNVIKVVNRRIYTKQESEEEIQVTVFGQHERYLPSVDAPITFPFLFEGTMIKNENGWVVNTISQGSIYTTNIGSEADDLSLDWEGE